MAQSLHENSLTAYAGPIRLAQKYIQRSTHYQHKLVALVIRGHNVLAVGWNKDHLHAEHSALNRAWRSGTDACILLVLRFRRDGSLGMARPCRLCRIRVAHAGIKCVIFSNRIGELEELEITPVKPKSALQYSFVSTTHGRRNR